MLTGTYLVDSNTSIESLIQMQCYQRTDGINDCAMFYSIFTVKYVLFGLLNLASASASMFWPWSRPRPQVFGLGLKHLASLVGGELPI